MNLKVELVEKERIEYIGGNVPLALFFARVLDYIVELEEEINKKDAEIERLEFEEEHEK